MEIIYNKKTVQFLRIIWYIDKKLPKQPNYNYLRIILILIFISGFMIMKNTTYFRTSFYNFQYKENLILHYYSLVIIFRYICALKFIGLCYVILERFKIINEILTKFAQDQVT